VKVVSTSKREPCLEPSEARRGLGLAKRGVEEAAEKKPPVKAAHIKLSLLKKEMGNFFGDAKRKPVKTATEETYWGGNMTSENHIRP